MTQNRFIIQIYAAIFLAIFVFTHAASAENIRKPAWAGQFYPDNAKALLGMIRGYTQQAEYPDELKNKPVKALILPHAGYIYSGFTTAHAGNLIKHTPFNKVIVMGPDHRVGFRNGAISSVSAYETPLGNVPVHPDAKALLNESRLFTSILVSDAREHSIEVILPYLQYYKEDFQLVPVVLGPSDVASVAHAIKSKLDAHTLLIASSDLSHFLPYDSAVKKDTETINLILNQNIDKLKKGENRACGMMPILVLLSVSLENQWTPVLLNYTNSGDTAGDKKRVVGYAAIAFF